MDLLTSVLETVRSHLATGILAYIAIAAATTTFLSFRSSSARSVSATASNEEERAPLLPSATTTATASYSTTTTTSPASRAERKLLVALEIDVTSNDPTLRRLAAVSFLNALVHVALTFTVKDAEADDEGVVESWPALMAAWIIASGLLYYVSPLSGPEGTKTIQRIPTAYPLLMFFYIESLLLTAYATVNHLSPSILAAETPLAVLSFTTTPLWESPFTILSLFSCIFSTTSFLLLAYYMSSLRDTLELTRDAIYKNAGMDIPCREAEASVFSRLFFSWANPMMRLGDKRPLNLEDIAGLKDSEKAEYIVEKYQYYKEKYPNLAIRILWFQLPSFAYQFTVALSSAVLALSGPYFLYQITGYIRDPQDRPVWIAFLYACCLGALALIRAILDGQTWHVGRCMAIRVRTALVNDIYAKALRRVTASTSAMPSAKSSETDQDSKGSENDVKKDKKEKEAAKKEEEKKEDEDSDQATVGKIVTLMSSDTEKIREGIQFIYLILCSPVQIGASITSLIYLLGWPALAGLGVMLLTIPATAALSTWANIVFERLMAATDKRTNTVNEVLQGIRIIKFFAWENQFLTKIQNARRQELRAIIQYYLQGAVGTFIWLMSPLLVSLFTFIALTQFAGRELNAQLAFTCISLFNTLRIPLLALPEVIIDLFQCRVSVNRIERFLAQEELEKYTVTADKLTRADLLGAAAKEVKVGFEDSAWFQYFSDANLKKAEKKVVKRWFWSKREESQEESETAPLLAHAASRDSMGTLHGSASSSSLHSTMNVREGVQPNTFTLRNLSLSFPSNQLSVICGPTGSGKSSLLQALLGELKRLQGSTHLPDPRFPVPLQTTPPTSAAEEQRRLNLGVAYVAQTSWLQNATIRDNITFGEPYDPVRYARVIQACALVKDLETFEGGDLTEIGEKGINLSGGQKQRVSLARAVYSRASVVLLDDPLSAVDAPTARHLYEYVVCGLLQGRTRILVTHATSLVLPRADYLVIIQSGGVLGAGPVREVLEIPEVANVLNKDEMNGVLERVGSFENLQGKNKEAEFLEGDLEAVEKVLDAKVGDRKDFANGKTKEDAKKLVEDEDSAKGAVKMEVYTSYIGSAGGVVFLLFFFIFNLSDRLTMVANDYWVKVWSDAYGNGTETQDLMGSLGVSKGVGMQHNAAGSWVGWAPLGSGSINSVLSTSLGWLLSLSTKSPIHAMFTSLADETTSEKPKVDTIFYITVYSCISLIWVVWFLLTYLVRCLGSYRASQKFHDGLMDRIMHAPMRFFDTTPIGRILSRAAKDINVIDTNVMPAFETFFAIIFDCLAVVFVVVWVTPTFLLAVVPMALVYRTVATRYLKCSRELKRMDSVTRSPIYSMFSETLVGASTIRAYGGEKRFHTENLRRLDINHRAYFYLWASNRWLGVRITCISASIIFFCASATVASRNIIGAGLAGMALTWALTFSDLLIWLVRVQSQLEMHLNGVERVGEYMKIAQEPDHIIESRRAPPSWPSRGEIKIQNLEMRYAPDQEPVLRDISLVIPPGSKVGVVGRTGAGKSSLSLSLFRIVEPSGGSITIDGIDISTLGLFDLRSRLTIIPQDPVLFAGTIRSNLDPFDEYEDEKLWNALKRVRFLESLHGSSANASTVSGSSASTFSRTESEMTLGGSGLLDIEDDSSNLHAAGLSPAPKSFVDTSNMSLDSSVSEGGTNYSQGQRQLLCLARALLKSSAVTIFDEATASVDNETDARIQQTIRSEEFEKTTVLSIAHRLRTVADYDLIVVLDKGRVHQFGSPYSLMTQEGQFREMCKESGEFDDLLEMATQKNLYGIVGLPNIGKSSLFNILTNSNVPSENYPFTTIDPSESKVVVSDARFDWLVDHYKPKSAVPAVLTVTDIAGLVKGAAAGEGLGNNFLANIRATDGIFHLVRAFDDDNITHVEGGIDPIRDLEIIHLELRLKDAEQLASLTSKKSRQAAVDKTKALELSVYQNLEHLLVQEDTDVRLKPWTKEEANIINPLQLLTAKPVVYLVNLSEKDAVTGQSKKFKLIKDWVAANRPRDVVIGYSGMLESELSVLETQEEKDEYLAEVATKYGVPKVESSMSTIVWAGYRAMRLQHYFTAGPEEVRAWTVKEDTKAPQAAGVIHSDFEKAFVAAEVMRFDDLKELGSEESLKKAGKYVTRGKDATIGDGDVVYFKIGNKKREIMRHIDRILCTVSVVMKPRWESPKNLQPLTSRCFSPPIEPPADDVLVSQADIHDVQYGAVAWLDWSTDSSASTPSASLQPELSPGVDKEFDGILYGLSSASKFCPKLLVDSIMVWRKSKSGPEDIPAFVYVPPTPPADRLTEATTPHYPLSNTLNASRPNSYKTKEMENIIKERKSLIANFILCRVLIEVVQQQSSDTLPNELGQKLEDMVFGQLQNTDPELISKSQNRLVNMNMFAQFAGALSSVRFATVSDRFVSEISELSKYAAKEAKLEMMIRCMRFLKIKIYPMDVLEETADFLQICATFFNNSHSARIKHAYADVFYELLEPVSSIATAEVNVPSWMLSIETIFGKAMRMVIKKVHVQLPSDNKPLSVQVALPLVMTLLCVSKKEFFLKNWPPVVEICVQRFRDKNLRVSALLSVTRMLWVYLFRSNDPSSGNAQRKVETLFKILFPPKSRIVNPPETNLDMFVRLVYIVLVKYSDSMLDLFTSALLGIETQGSMGAPSSGTVGSSSTLDGTTVMSTFSNSFRSSSDGDDKSTLSNSLSDLSINDLMMNPERLIIALRSFMLLLADMEEVLDGKNSQTGSVFPGFTAGNVSTTMASQGNGFVVVQGKIKLQPPPFPTQTLPLNNDLEALRQMRTRPTTTINNAPPSAFSLQAMAPKEETPRKINGVMSDKIVQRLSNGVRECLDRLNQILGKVALALDKSIGSNFCNASSTYTSTGSTSSVSGSSGSSSNLRRTSNSDISGDKNPSSQSDLSQASNRSMLYDFMRNYIDCLPRFIPTSLSATRIVEMLTRYTFNIDESVADASVGALYRISEIVQGENDEYGGKLFWSLGTPHRPGKSLVEGVAKVVGATLSALMNERLQDIMIVAELGEEKVSKTGFGVYVDMMDKWLQEITKGGGMTGETSRLEDALQIVATIEAQGVLALLSTSPVIRRIGVKLLRLAKRFDSTLLGEQTPDPDFYKPRNSKPSPKTHGAPYYQESSVLAGIRVVHIMEQAGHDLISRHFADPSTTSSFRPDQQKQHQQNQQSLLKLLAKKDALVAIAISDSPDDISIWNRSLPDFVSMLFEYGDERAIRMAVIEVSDRLQSLQPIVMALADSTGSSGKHTSTAVKLVANTQSNSLPPLSPALENFLQHWRALLLFQCACIDSISEEHSSQDDKAKSACLVSDKALYNMVIPFLSCERSSVRKVAVLALGVSNWRSYKHLLECLQVSITTLLEESKSKVTSASFGSRSYENLSSTSKSSSSKANTPGSKKLERIRIELLHIFSLLSDAVDYCVHHQQDHLLKSIIMLIRDCAEQLTETENNIDWSTHMLRYYFCSLVDRFFDHLATSSGHLRSSGVQQSGGDSPLRYFPFFLRVFTFRLLEKWCGVGAQASAYTERQTKSLLAVLDTVKDVRERSMMAATSKEQRHALEIAALKAMSSLCKGSIREEGFVDPTIVSKSFDINDLALWLHGMFSTADESIHLIATLAVENLLSYNPDSEELMEIAIRECYQNPSKSSKAIGFFSSLVFVFAGRPDDTPGTAGVCGVGLEYPCVAHRLITLALFKAGDLDVNIRKAAIRLLRAVEVRLWGDEVTLASHDDSHLIADDENSRYEAAAIASTLPIMYKYAQTTASARLAGDRPLFTCDMLSEMFLRIEQLGQVETMENKERIRDILIFMVPWIRNLNLHLVEEETNAIGGLVGTGGPDTFGLQNVFLPSGQYPASLARAEAILTNLFRLTIQYGDEYVTEVENLWVQMVESDSDLLLDKDSSHTDKTRNMLDELSTLNTRAGEHIEMIVDYLISVGLRYKNPKFVAYAKKVVVYLSRTDSCPTLVQSLLTRISPRSLVPLDASKVQTASSVEIDFHKVDIKKYLPEMPTRPAFSIGGLAGILLVDMVVEIGSIPEPEHLALILHVIFIQLDHFISLVCEQMRTLLINLIQTMIPRHLASTQIDELCTRLILKEGRRLWAYEDITPQSRDITSLKQLMELVEKTKDLVSAVEPDIYQLWGDKALSFAVGCPVRHAACRSLQVFRALKPSFSQRTLCELLYRLSTTIGDSTEEIHGFTLEILITLDTMITGLSAEEILLFPQFFWVCVACLHSPHEWEYYEALLLLKKILAKIDIGDQTAMNILLISFPAKWRGTFSGIQPLLLRGMLSSKTEGPTLDVLNMLLDVENDSLVDRSPARTLFGILANLPRLLQGFTPDPSTDGASEVGLTLESCYSVAQRIADLAHRQGNPSLARLFVSYSRQRFRSKEDFSRQLVYSLRDAYFPAHEASAIQFLFTMLGNLLPFYKKRCLVFLKTMLPILNEKPFGSTSDSSQPRGLQTLGATALEEDFVIPLMEMLSGDMADVATDVLDEVLKIAAELPQESNLRYVFGGKSVFRLTREAVAAYEKETHNPAQSTDGLKKEGAGGVDESELTASVNKHLVTTGWKSKDIAKATKVTRYNIAGVAGTCSTTNMKSDRRGLLDSGNLMLQTQTPPRSSVESGSGTAASSPLRDFVPVDPAFSPNTTTMSGIGGVGGLTGASVGNLDPKQFTASGSNPKGLKLIEQLDELDAFFFGDDDGEDDQSDEGGELGGAFGDKDFATFEPHLDSSNIDLMQEVDSSSLPRDGKLDHDRKHSLETDGIDVLYSTENFETSNMIGGGRDKSFELQTAAGEMYPTNVMSEDEEEDVEYTKSPPEFNHDKEESRSTSELKSTGVGALNDPPSLSNSSSTTTTSNRAIAKSANVSAARRLLCQDSTYVVVHLWFTIPYVTAASDLRFPLALSSDISQALGIHKEDVQVDLIEPGTGAQSGGMKATVRIKGGCLTALGSNQGFGRGQENVEAVAYAEDLVALIAGEDEDARLRERDVLMSGALVSKLDFSARPEIYINFMGMPVKYIPEGIRYELPHRRNLKRSKMGGFGGGTYSTPPSVMNSPVLGPTRAATSQRRLGTFTLDSAVDALRIFPAAFELLLQLYEDWLSLADELKTKLTQSTERNNPGLSAKHGETLAGAYMAIRGLRGPRKGYCPCLLTMADIEGISNAAGGNGLSDAVDEEALLDAGRLLTSIQESDPMKLSAFLDRREQQVSGVNNQISLYLSSRQGFGGSMPSDLVTGSDRMEMLVRGCVELGTGLMTLYGMVLALEGLLDEFMGKKAEEKRQSRMDESLRCVQARAALNELLNQKSI
ncbi:hypothetical protein HDV05_007983 [Chytridiales sp. JEL 0842]|nr:hypothetical protein HDV05_007983 [Chytridiales sp. JEL 0842]